jgi:PD-(D/E)XK nuclease superfamily
MNPPTREQLEAAHCWEADDHVPRRPEMTVFRRRTRYHQARWREDNGHPIGTQPIVPKPDGRVRPVGSRLPLDYAHDTGANFVTPAARDAAGARSASVEAHQTLDHQRLWADLLSSPALSFNLFGDLAADPALADRAVRRWFPDAPGHVTEARFAHSPGRFDPAYLNSLRAFDTAFVLDLDDGSRGIVAVDVNYHERNKPEIPRPENLARYREVAARSRAFAGGAVGTLEQRGDLCVMWLEHLLLLSMLQHAGAGWAWGRYLVVHPAANSDLVDACGRYRAMLADETTFATMTLEQLLDSDAIPAPTVAALGDRYLPDRVSAGRRRRRRRGP